MPVGEDQQQHIEICRDLAESSNRTFKGKRTLSPLPQHVISKSTRFSACASILTFLQTSSCRVLSLCDPSSKMSKSSPDLNSRILLTHTPA